MALVALEATVKLEETAVEHAAEEAARAAEEACASPALCSAFAAVVVGMALEVAAAEV